MSYKPNLGCKTNWRTPRLFLYIDTLPETQKQAAQSRLLSGGVVIEPHTYPAKTGKKKTWRYIDGLCTSLGWPLQFIPGGTRDQAHGVSSGLFATPHNCTHQMCRSAKVFITNRGGTSPFYFRFYRKAIVTAVYDTEFTADYFRPDRQPWLLYFPRGSPSAELENPGKAQTSVNIQWEMTMGTYGA